MHERRETFLTIACVCVFIFAVHARGADHPSLVDPSKTKCQTCHADRVSGKVRHAVVDECTTCHEFSKSEGKTAVALVEDSPALCLMCHTELEAAAQGSMASPHYPVTDTCLNCHDPHSTDNPRMLIRQVPDLCSECHDLGELRTAHGVSIARADCVKCHMPHGSDQESMLIAGLKHPPFAEASCDACHRRGLARKAAKDASQICFACHDAEGFKGPVVHTAVKEGLCLACHDPHLSANKRLLKATGQSLCYTCHKDIERKVAQKSVHEAVPDSCDTCHAPHTAENATLLPEPVPALCATCHDLDDAELRGKHLGAEMSSLHCVGCHDPHGSPEAPIIQSASLHPPFNDRMCDMCHQGSPTKLVENGSSDLCYACHSKIQEIVANASVPHPAMEVVDCRECHSPHASKQRKLKKEPGGGVCLTCHDDKGAVEGEFQHGAITMIGCESCHEPHGGTRESMLRTDDMDQHCLGCHDRKRWAVGADGGVTIQGRFQVSERQASQIRLIELSNGSVGHPIAGHKTLGALSAEEKSFVRNADLDALHCTTCHDPHKGATPRLFVNGALDACGLCHAK